MAKTSTIKSKTLFEHLKDLHTKKEKWENLSEADKKSFSPFMINRFLSMNPDYTDFVNELQAITYNVEPKFVYLVYQSVLPKSNGFFAKYIKANNSKIYNKDLLDLLSTHFESSKAEVAEWLDILPSLESLRPSLEMFGLCEKEITKLIKFASNEE